MNSKVLTPLSQGVLVFCVLLCVITCDAAEPCSNPVGKIVSFQGGIQVQRRSGWLTVGMDDLLCPGDVLRVAENGRAAVALANETILRIDQKSTLTFPQLNQEKYSIIELLRGVLHIFSHRPRSLEVVTPYVNGFVEGTEFLVHVKEDNAVITVFEGLVTAKNDMGELRVSSNQSIIAKKGNTPAFTTVVRPRDAVSWTLYFPMIIDVQESQENESVARHIKEASVDLTMGRLNRARKSLATILKRDEENAEVYSLLSIIETVLNNKELALDYALQAVKIKPGSSAAALALSYAHQAEFNIGAALEVLEQGARTHEKNGLIQARLAEILLAAGETDQALEAATRAVKINPQNGLSQTVLGFVYLSRIEVDKAQAAFVKALTLDTVAPLPRLGLGLAKIRNGMVEEGRTDLEIAAALDPGNSLIRSYLGKAYFEEKRNAQSSRQYAIAKELDPADPTPWFYDALRKQSINRPVEALYSLQQSISLNDNRAVYRSRLLLDDDLASRSAALGRVYSDLGFEHLARVEGNKSLQTDPTNYSAHRFLADIYSAIPRHEIARVSELLQSQLLQPINVTPLQPQLAESNLAIHEGAGPSSPSSHEFSQLFLRDRIGIQASGVLGSNDIFGDEIVIAGVEGRLSYSLGQFHYQTDGIRENNDRDQDIYTGYFQSMLSPATSVMAELRYREDDYGDTNMRIDPDDFSRSLHQSQQNKSARIGLRHMLQPSSTLIGTAIFGTDDAGFTTRFDNFFFADSDYSLENDSQMVELQHIYRADFFNIRSGAGYLNSDKTESYVETFPFSFSYGDEFQTDHVNVYSYSLINLVDDVALTLGFGFNSIDSRLKNADEFSPKLGVTWQASGSTQVRAAAFKAATRFLFNAQTIEPTNVAGFNQFFDDMEGTTSWTYGAGIDHAFSKDWHAGAQFFLRELEVPYLDYSPTYEELLEEDDWQEDVGTAYLYWTPANWMSLGVEYTYERFEHDQFEGILEIREVITHRITPGIKLFCPYGLNGSVEVSYVDQEGEFGSRFMGYEENEDQFWVIDLSLSYRLPKRLGILRFEIRNLLDEEFFFLDTEPANPRLQQEQQVIASFTVSF